MIIDPNKVDDQVAYILDHFDFYRVWQVMNFLQWTWHGEGVPTIPALKSRAESMLRQVAREPGTKVSSGGGFQVRKLQNELGEKYLTLEFVLEEKDGEYV